MTSRIAEATAETTADAPDIVRIEGVSKRFTVRRDNSLKERLVTLGRLGRRHREDFWALRDLDLSITAGSTVGLIGHNGSGKSTLLKVIGGIIDPSRGNVLRRGRIAALLELGAGFHPDLTGLENVFLNASILGLSRAETEAVLPDILRFADIGEFIDTQVKFYSSGMFVRLAFAVAVHTDPDLLLVDEVLAVGDEAFQRKCMDKIRTFQQEGRTIVLVTHSLGQVLEMCDRAVLLDHGRVVYDGQPRDGVRMFRDLLEDHRQEVEADGADESDIPRVVDVEAREASGAAAIRPGQDLVISCTFESPRPLDDWVCAVQIDNVHGQAVYGTTTKRTTTALPRLDGSATVELVVHETSFGAGKYFVNVSLMDSAGRHLHDAPQAASFDALDDGMSAGTAWARPEFRLNGG